MNSLTWFVFSSMAIFSSNVFAQSTPGIQWDLDQAETWRVEVGAQCGSSALGSARGRRPYRDGNRRAPQRAGCGVIYRPGTDELLVVELDHYISEVGEPSFYSISRLDRNQLHRRAGNDALSCAERFASTNQVVDEPA